MTKTLTEQWKSGELKEGWYYLSITPNKKCIDYYYGKDFERYNEWAITKVLAPVPSYKEFFEDKKFMKDLERDYSELINQKVELLEKIEELKDESLYWQKSSLGVL